MKHKMTFVAAGVAAVGLLLGMTGIASAAEDDTFSPLNRDPAASRIVPPSHMDQDMTFVQPGSHFLDEDTGGTYDASINTGGSDLGNSNAGGGGMTSMGGSAY